MAVLSPPLSPLLADALALARRWCAGQVIDGAPALRHAVRVARTLAAYVPDVPDELLAAALLHDSPDFAPGDVDLDALLDRGLSPAVTRIVRGLQAEHAALDTPGGPPIQVDDLELLLASTADKIVALDSMLTRARTVTDPGQFWRARPAFRALLGYLRDFVETASPSLPPSMAAELDRLVSEAEDVTSKRAGR